MYNKYDESNGNLILASRITVSQNIVAISLVINCVTVYFDHFPIHQARHLLDRVRAKGELAANVLLQYIQERQESGSASHQENPALSKGVSVF